MNKKLFFSLFLLITTGIFAQAQEKNFPNDNFETKQDTQIWFIASELPSFQYQGCTSTDESFLKYVHDSIRLPSPDCTGTVLVRFVVETDGMISHIEVRKGLDDCPGYANEVERLLASMPKWQPGKNGNDTVRVSVSMPIIFQAKEQ
jgi:protein TonB